MKTRYIREVSELGLSAKLNYLEKKGSFLNSLRRKANNLAWKEVCAIPGLRRYLSLENNEATRDSYSTKISVGKFYDIINNYIEYPDSVLSSIASYYKNGIPYCYVGYAIRELVSHIQNGPEGIFETVVRNYDIDTCDIIDECGNILTPDDNQFSRYQAYLFVKSVRCAIMPSKYMIVRMDTNYNIEVEYDVRYWALDSQVDLENIEKHYRSNGSNPISDKISFYDVMTSYRSLYKKDTEDPRSFLLNIYNIVVVMLNSRKHERNEKDI